MLKKLAIALILVASTTMGSIAADAKIAVVNMQKIMNESTAAKDLKVQLDNKRKEYQAQIKAQEDRLKKEDEDLAKQKNILAKDALQQKQKDFVNQINAVKQQVQTKRINLDNAYKQALNELNKAILQSVTELSSEKGFNIAVPTSQLIYATNDFDITDDVLKKLNSKLPKVTLKF